LSARIGGTPGGSMLRDMFGFLQDVAGPSRDARFFVVHQQSQAVASEEEP
jgi:hypothetical protein